jgi:hypothetical protein
MTKRIEDELRELLGTSAEGFDMDGAIPPRVRKRGRARAFRALSAVVAVAVLGGALSVVTLRGHPAGSTGTTNRATGGTGVRLLSYDGDPSSPPDATALQEQAQCMRDHGFDVPFPVETGIGREIVPPAGSIDRSSPAWQEAEFVTCSLFKFMSGPPPAARVFTAPLPLDIQAFLDCMKGQGFDLPDPVQEAEGMYRIDLSGTSIDTSSDAWNRALFLTCAPPEPSGPSGPSGGPSGPSGGPSGPSA